MESTSFESGRRAAKPQGRPRDSRIDDAVLRATNELLEEIGYARLTIPVVAARAGATPPAVYRRFPTKIELVFAAVFPPTPREELPLTGDLRAVVRGLLEGSINLFSRPAVHSAVSGLTAELPSEPGLSARLLDRLQGSTYERLQQYLDDAAARGLATDGIDARLLMDMIGGTVMMSMATERTLDDAWLEHNTTLIVRGMTR
ncbi:TetR/AcrR family transcriptional regulator [Mycobacterium heidelbergense]|uniref:TetR/AcrR family transcriptional regulator n=1 Tax=Mycobacterium heidelbergense TaxID=53376 RepID=UPI003CF7D652